MFRCCNCHENLVKTKGPNGLYWKCSSCKGRAVSLSILRRVLDKKYVNQMWQSAFKAKNLGQDCPICRKAMYEIYKPEQDVYLDVCKRCQFVWFDPNEYEVAPKIEKVPAKEDNSALSKEAIQMLAIAKVKLRPHKPTIVDDQLPDAWWKGLLGVFGFPVEEDLEKPSRPAVATWVLSAAIFLVSVLSFSHLMDVVMAYGLIPAQAMRGGGITFLTSFFLHGGILHLLGNLYFLLVFGDNVEDYLGAPKFLLMTFAAALLGSLLHITLDPASTIPVIGASGGISAIIVFYALQFPHARLGVFIWIFAYIRWLNVSVRFALFVWIVLQIMGAFEQAAGLTNVSAMAHLGGAMVGFIFWWFFKEDPQQKASQRLKDIRMQRNNAS